MICNGADLVCLSIVLIKSRSIIQLLRLAWRFQILMSSDLLKKPRQFTFYVYQRLL
jgi:hypothetical protein